jgi:hypothetical protein
MCVYLDLFIVTTGSPYERRLQKSVRQFRFLEDSARYRGFSNSIIISGFFKSLMYSTTTLDLGLKSYPKDR